jgi:hypothetical protein
MILYSVLQHSCLIIVLRNIDRCLILLGKVRTRVREHSLCVVLCVVCLFEVC